MALSNRRKMLLMRIGALIKNLEKHPEDFTLDKQLDRTIETLERFYTHASGTVTYRKAMAEKREAKLAAEQKKAEPEVKPEVKPKPVSKPAGDERVS
jgi:hypothetical protein